MPDSLDEQHARSMSTPRHEQDQVTSSLVDRLIARNLAEIHAAGLRSSSSSRSGSLTVGSPSRSGSDHSKYRREPWHIRRLGSRRHAPQQPAHDESGTPRSTNRAAHVRQRSRQDYRRLHRVQAAHGPERHGWRTFAQQGAANRQPEGGVADYRDAAGLPAEDPGPTEAADRWIGIEAAARHLAIPTRTMYRLAQRHSVPAVKVGRTWRFRSSSLDAYLERVMLAQASDDLAPAAAASPINPWAELDSVESDGWEEMLRRARDTRGTGRDCPLPRHPTSPDLPRRYRRADAPPGRRARHAR